MSVVLERSKHCFRLVENGANASKLAFRGDSVTLKSEEGPETFFAHWDIEENNPGQVQILSLVEAERRSCDFADAEGVNMDEVYEAESGWGEDEDEEGDEDEEDEDEDEEGDEASDDEEDEE